MKQRYLCFALPSSGHVYWSICVMWYRKTFPNRTTVGILETLRETSAPDGALPSDLVTRGTYQDYSSHPRNFEGNFSPGWCTPK
jgi:hypothetical protein